MARPQCCRSIEPLLSHNLTSNSNGHEHLIFFDLQESSITEAVERQLNATTAATSTVMTTGSNPAAGPTSTPQMTKKSLTGNSGIMGGVGGGGGGGSSGLSGNCNNGGNLTPNTSGGGTVCSHHEQQPNTPISGIVLHLLTSFIKFP